MSATVPRETLTNASPAAAGLARLRAWAAAGSRVAITRTEPGRATTTLRGYVVRAHDAAELFPGFVLMFHADEGPTGLALPAAWPWTITPEEAPA
jgi:hypothetical protein